MSQSRLNRGHSLLGIADVLTARLPQDGGFSDHLHRQRPVAVFLEKHRDGVGSAADNDSRSPLAVLDGGVDGYCRPLFMGGRFTNLVVAAAIAVAARFGQRLAEIPEQNLRTAFSRFGVTSQHFHSRAIDTFAGFDNFDCTAHRGRLRFAGGGESLMARLDGTGLVEEVHCGGEPAAPDTEFGPQVFEPLGSVSRQRRVDPIQQLFVGVMRGEKPCQR